MGRKAGGLKYGGRKAGTPNKKTLQIEEIFNQFDFDPIERMIRIVIDPDTDPSIGAQLLKELAQYRHPKRKAIEMSLETISKQMDQMSEEELVRLAEDKIKQIKGMQ